MELKLKDFVHGPRDMDPLFAELPVFENLDFHKHAWDYYDGPCSGEVEVNGEILMFWWWNGDRDFILVRAAPEIRMACKHAASWEENIMHAGDCTVVGRASW